MKERVLFVDDDPGITRAFGRFFSQEAFQVETARSGSEALSILEVRQVDVVLSDQQMPGMTGLELLEEIRAIYPDTMRIMLTGYATLETVLVAINRAEVARFLLKPCSFSDLRTVIGEVLTKKRAHQETRHLLEIVRTQGRLLDRIEAELPAAFQRLAACQKNDPGDDETRSEELTQGIRHEIARFEERRARRQLDERLQT